jgi:hypothetical protein
LNQLTRVNSTRKDKTGLDFTRHTTSRPRRRRSY